MLQIPGLAELFIVLLILVLLAVPVLAVLGLVYFLRGRSANKERVDRLEAELEELRSELGVVEESGTDRTDDPE